MLNIRNFIVDPDDGDTSLHYAAFDKDVNTLRALLSQTKSRKYVNRRVRPFGATPIRLAATSGSHPCISCLIEHGADVDLVDVKGQTPLFLAVQNNFVDCARLLLEHGANPNGSRRNRSSPLILAAKNGSVDCLQVLLEFGAETERMDDADDPGFPLLVSAVYGHLRCYAALLLAGAQTDLFKTGFSKRMAVGSSSLPHVLVRHDRPVIYAQLFVEFGGCPWQPDAAGRLVTEFGRENECRSFFRQVMGSPLSLRSSCRITVRREMGRSRLDAISRLHLPSSLIDFLLYKDLIN